LTDQIWYMVPRNWTGIWKAVQMAGRTFRVSRG